MGNCVKATKTETYASENNRTAENNDHKVKFLVKVSKVKVRDFPLSKSAPISVSFKFPSDFFNFSETEPQDKIYRWDDSVSFTYISTLKEMDYQKLDITVKSKNKVQCASEISIRSIIDGPIHQNTSLINAGLVVGRISFNIELLEETILNISPQNLNFYLREESFGVFCTAVKFASDFVMESCKSEASENLQWNLKDSDVSLKLTVTMKNIRDAALQIRLYKQYKDKFQLAGECWVSFTKLFAQEMGSIYRKESFLEVKANKEENFLDFEKILKNINREYLSQINEDLWLCGRRIGTVDGMLKIVGMPTFVQLISGVNTENGITVQNLNIINQNKKKSKKNLPKEILEIRKLTNKIKNSIQIKPAKVGPAYERELFAYKKTIIDRLCELLLISSKESMITYTYSNSKSLMKSQMILIELSNHLIEYAPLVNYDIKPFYFKCILLVVNRGELDIGHLSHLAALQEILAEKRKIALEYYKMIQEVLKLSLSRMVFKGIDESTQEYIDRSLAICWFRLPQFRENLKEIVKKKSYYAISEWRNIESNLEEDVFHDISNPLDWGVFYQLIPSDHKNDEFEAAMLQQEWRSRIKKRGITFFSFLDQWLEHVYKQSVSQHFIWSCIPGYKVLLKAFLIELKERKIIEYPETLISCACKMLYNPRVLSVIIKILFNKANIYEFNTIQETFRLLNRLFDSFYALNRKLLNTFDYEFFILGLKTCLDDESALNISKCLWFIYNQYHLLQGVLRKQIIYNCVIRKNYNRLFYHWSKEVRSMFHSLILYRIKSQKFLNFENNSTDLPLNEKILDRVNKNLMINSTESLKPLQVPYLILANTEFSKVKAEYKTWKKSLPTSNGLLYGVSNNFPYPKLSFKLNFIDLSERRLEEQW